MDANNENHNSAPEKMEIEISRYKTLVEALRDPKQVVRLIIIISAVVLILAFGIIGIVYGIKRYYPYKSINSNDYGATFIKDEDNEIIYWLFNTADLWANSGIEVEEGDVISVHTSGAFNPAIHHLVQDADNNIVLRDPWVLSGGKGRLEYGQLYNQERARDKFRIASDAPFSAILMQVIPNKISKRNRGWIRDSLNAPYVDGCVDAFYFQYQKADKKISPDIYVIGHGKESVRIRTSGVLHFAVNDVPLTHSNIIRMEWYEKERQRKIAFKDVKGIWYFIPNSSFKSIFNWEALDERIDFSNWFVQNSSRKAKGDTILCTEFWNKDYLRQIKVMDSSLWFKSDFLDDKYNKLIVNYLKLLEEHANGTIKDSTKMYLGRLKDNAKKQKLSKADADSAIMYLGCLKDSEITQEAKADADSTIKYLGCLKDNIKKQEKIQKLPKAYADNMITRKYLEYLKDTLCLIDTFWAPKENEYYKDRRFVDAWFVDNVGSFMIVIERKTDK